MRRRERIGDPRDSSGRERRKDCDAECRLAALAGLASFHVRPSARERRARRVLILGIHAVHRAVRGREHSRGRRRARAAARDASTRHPPRRHVRAHRSAGEPRAGGIRRGRHRGDDSVPPGRPQNQATGVHPARRGRRVRVDAPIALGHRQDGRGARALPRSHPDDRRALTQLGGVLHRVRGAQGVHGTRARRRRRLRGDRGGAVVVAASEAHDKRRGRGDGDGVRDQPAVGRQDPAAGAALRGVARVDAETCSVQRRVLRASKGRRRGGREGLVQRPRALVGGDIARGDPVPGVRAAQAGAGDAAG